MKWIGQHIWSFISRFRNDVYLESVSSGTIASGGNLGLDSNNKIVKADTESGELSFTGSTADGVLTYLDADSIQVESTLTYEGSFQQLTMEGSIAPTFFLKHTADNATDAEIKFYNTKGGAAGDNNDTLGSIVFFGQNNAGSPETLQYGHFKTYITDVTDGSEALTMEFQLKADGANGEGLKMIGSGSSEIIDVEIGHGATSTTTIAGKATIPSRIYAYPGTSDGNHTAGDIMYYDSGTATTVAGKIYYFNGSGSWTIANADAVADSTGMLAVALGNNPDVDGMLLRGFVTLAAINGTEDHGAKLYLHTADGEASVNAPGSGNVVRVIGYNLHNSNDSVYFNPDNSWVEVS